MQSQANPRSKNSPSQDQNLMQGDHSSQVVWSDHETVISRQISWIRFRMIIVFRQKQVGRGRCEHNVSNAEDDAIELCDFLDSERVKKIFEDSDVKKVCFISRKKNWYYAWRKNSVSVSLWKFCVLRNQIYFCKRIINSWLVWAAKYPIIHQKLQWSLMETIHVIGPDRNLTKFQKFVQFGVCLGF